MPHYHYATDLKILFSSKTDPNSFSIKKATKKINSIIIKTEKIMEDK